MEKEAAGAGGGSAPDLSWLRWAVAGRSMQPGEESGDRCLVQPFPGGVLVAVVDGLGHGERAAEAAGLALQTLAGCPHEPVDWLFRLCHTALAATRGVVMSLVSFRCPGAAMTWLGVGNVAGVVRRVDRGPCPVYDWLLLPGGIVGRRLPVLHPTTVYLGPGDTLVLATDGVSGGFTAGLDWHASPQQIADSILDRNGQGRDDALALALRYLGGEVASQAIRQ